MGVADVADGAVSAEAMLDLADQALYFAKENGRNQLVRWSEDIVKDARKGLWILFNIRDAKILEHVADNCLRPLLIGWMPE